MKYTAKISKFMLHQKIFAYIVHLETKKIFNFIYSFKNISQTFTIVHHQKKSNSIKRHLFVLYRWFSVLINFGIKLLINLDIKLKTKITKHPFLQSYHCHFHKLQVQLQLFQIFAALFQMVAYAQNQV